MSDTTPPDDTTEGLRERLAELLATNGPLPGARAYTKADDVLAVVSPVLERLRAEDKLMRRERDTFATALEKAQAERDAALNRVKALEANGNELMTQRDALKAAIERVRRMAQVWVDMRPTYPTATREGHAMAYTGEQILAALDAPETPGDAETEDRDG